MGKAQILSGGATGLYNVRILKETAKAAVRKTLLQTRLIALDAAIAVKETEFNAANAEYEAKKLALMNAISAYNAGTITMDDVKKAQTAMLTAYAESTLKQKAYNRLSLEITSIRKQLKMIESIFANEDRTGVWCADLTEDLTGEVGSIEVNGEKNEIILMPAGKTGLGQIQEAGAGTPAGVFYNWAVRPGWQKWKPTYRIGTITYLDGDLCNVTLEPAYSIDQNLNINQDETLISVPIEYMTCNGYAFEVGDEVVVEFEGQDWNSPKVVGFRENPKACGISLWVISTIKATGINTPLMDPGYWEWNPEIEEFFFVPPSGYTIMTLYGAENTVRLVRFDSATYGSYLNREYTLIEETVIPGYLIWDPATNRPVFIAVECSAVICGVGPTGGVTDIKYLYQSHYFNGVWYRIYFHVYPMLHYVGSVPIFNGEYTEHYLCNDIDLTESFGITREPMAVVTKDKKLLFVCPETSEWLSGYIYDTAWNVVGLVTTVGVYPSGYSYYAVSGNIYNAELKLVGKTREIDSSQFAYGSFVSKLRAIWGILRPGGTVLGWQLNFSNSYLGWWPIIYTPGGGLMDVSTVHFAGARGLGEAYDSTIQG